MDNLQICAPRAAQGAVARALPALAEWRAANRHEIEVRADALRQVMTDLDGWKLEAIGAYFAFVRHPFEGRSSTQVAEQLAKRAGILSHSRRVFRRAPHSVPAFCLCQRRCRQRSGSCASVWWISACKSIGRNPAVRGEPPDQPSTMILPARYRSVTQRLA